MERARRHLRTRSRATASTARALFSTPANAGAGGPTLAVGLRTDTIAHRALVANMPSPHTAFNLACGALLPCRLTAVLQRQTRCEDSGSRSCRSPTANRYIRRARAARYDPVVVPC